MNWGNKIALAYCLFVAFMIALVVACIKQNDIFLVSEDYYQQEIKYQDRIDKTENARLLNGVTIQQDDATSSLNLDLTAASQGAIGTVTFYRPSNPKLDVVFPVNVSQEGLQQIPTGKFLNGLWVVKVDWNKGGKAYYSEQKIQI